jgi:dienelactone hydrolase
MTFKSSILTALIMMCFVFSSCAGLTAPVRYEPSSGKGPVVLMISGRTGPMLYAEFARRLAETGYHVLLYDGNDFPFNQTQACQAKIRAIIKTEFPSSQRPIGKVAVVGYSLGGATALACAAGMPDEIAVVVAYYPATKFITDHHACVDRFRVPIVVLQGEEDRYFDCCIVETIRDIKQAALKKGRDVELIVYPQAGHGFNLGPRKNKELDLDSWRKTTNALKRYLP